MPIIMPRQIFDAKTFKEILPRAEEVRVVRSDGKTKLKLRTKSMLYTYVTDEIEAERLLKGIDKPVVDLTPKPKPPEKKEEVEQKESKEEKPEAKVQEEEKPKTKKKATRSKGKKKEQQAEQ